MKKSVVRAHGAIKKSALLTTMLSGLVLAAAVSAPAHAIISRPDSSPTAIRDTTNQWPWVGQMIAWDNRASASFGLCTGQVINPRVVLFAAHCFGGVASGNSERYGTGTGLRDMSFMFNTNNLSALRQWIGFDPSTTGIGASNEVNNVYRVIDIIGHPRNALNGFTAGNADVALAVLDAPINGFNGYGMLFSPLTALEQVQIAGYGRSGNSDQGQVFGVDWWRRAGDNFLGFLGSDNDIFSTPLFGGVPTNDPFYNGDLYWMDTDSPTNPRPSGDFNIFGGAALPNEAGIAQGDSGGAMWIRRNGVPIALGVASYGYSFGPQFGRGAITAHTPLFAYWDFIVANNAYVYASGVTGGGAWENGATWVQMLDPNYLTLGAGGALVNALPTTAPVSDGGGAPNVGGVRPLPVNPVPNANGSDFGDTGAVSGRLTVNLDGESQANHGFVAAETPDADGILRVTRKATSTVDSGSYVGLDTSTRVGLAGAPQRVTVGEDLLVRPDPEPASSGFFPIGTTPLSGPGSTGFVPNNTAGVPGVAFQNAARYFEVQLVNSGTVTLSSARTIDRLRIMSAPAGLTINSGANLTTIMSSSMEAGTLTVNGTLRARGVMVSGGLLQGTGTIQAAGGVGVSGAVQTAGVTMITGGGFAPGGMGTVGTFNFQGNVGMGNNATTMLDVSGVGTADRFNVANLAGVASGTNGGLGLAGALGVNFIGGYVPTFGTTWTVANASGGVTGGFANLASNLPGVLRPETLIVGNDLQLRITAIPFDTFLSGRATPEQLAIATSLNQVRGVAGVGTASNLFAGLDRLDPTTLAATLEAMKPSNALAVNQNVRMDSNLAATALFDRLTRVRSAERGTMAFNVTGAAGMANVSAAGMTGSAVAAIVDEAVTTTSNTTSIDPDWSVFATVTYGFGSSDVQSNSTSEPNGWTLTAGADRRVSDNFILGFGGSYMAGDAGLSLVGNSIESTGWSANAYAAIDLGPKTSLDLWVRGGAGTLDTVRTQAIGSSSFTSSGEADTNTLAWGATWVHNLAPTGSVQWSPVLAAVASETSIDSYIENSGSASLQVDARTVSSFQLKAGLQVAAAEGTEAAAFRPYARASLVRDSANSADVVTARFVSGGPNAVPFTITGVEPTESFGELAAGFTFQNTQTMTLSMEATHTVGRDELELGSVSLTGRIKF